jgi:hypothetical protein
MRAGTNIYKLQEICEVLQGEEVGQEDGGGYRFEKD